jgi:type IV pilus assembly protein PilN
VINVNLLPREERFEEVRTLAAPRTKFLVPLAAAVLLLVPTGTLLVHQQTRLQALQRDIRLAEQESATLKPRVARVQQLEAQRADLLRRMDLVRQLNQERALSVRLMDELQRQVPGHLWLTKVGTSGPGTVSIEGAAFTPLRISDLMRSLEESRLFQGLDLTLAERVQMGDEKVLKFTITAAVEHQP